MYEFFEIASVGTFSDFKRFFMIVCSSAWIFYIASDSLGFFDNISDSVGIFLRIVSDNAGFFLWSFAIFVSAVFGVLLTGLYLTNPFRDRAVAYKVSASVLLVITHFFAGKMQCHEIFLLFFSSSDWLFITSIFSYSIHFVLVTTCVVFLQPSFRE